MRPIERHNWTRIAELRILRRFVGPDMHPAIDRQIAERKKAIRFLNRKLERFDAYNGHRVVISEENGGTYWEKIILPERIPSAESAEAFFLETWEQTYVNSQYDCTGQAFTLSYKIAKQGGRFVVYHNVGLDI